MGHLPQGAPTSPMLANLVCVSLDSELQRLAGREGLIYTRYADDMTFSGQLSDRTSVAKLIGEIFALVGKHGLVINPKKTSIAKNGARKIVTGLSIDGDEVRLPRSFKDKLRKDLYFLGKFGLDGHCTRIGQKNHLSYLLHLDGQIRYAIKVEPIVGGVYSKEFNRMFPDFSQLRQLIDLE
jgi:RNA-directed DNA polymerase